MIFPPQQQQQQQQEKTFVCVFVFVVCLFFFGFVVFYFIIHEFLHAASTFKRACPQVHTIFASILKNLNHHINNNLPNINIINNNNPIF